MAAWKVNPNTGATSGFPRDMAEANFGLLPAANYDLELPFEIHTDKNPVKFVPCLTCRRACLVTTFYVPAWMKACRTCSGDSDATKGSVAVPQAGRTDPAKAVNLADCLINDEFAEVFCPFGHGMMELKSVNHNPRYGPRELIGYDRGEPVHEQKTGESVLHQCNECLAVVSMSTVHVSKYRRKNEARQGMVESPPIWEDLLGVRIGEDE